MAIEVQCPKCRKGLRVADDGAGKPFICPYCQAVLSVPGMTAPEQPIDEGRIHPLVYAAVGGGSVAVLALVVGLACGVGNPRIEPAQQTVAAPNNVAATLNDLTVNGGEVPRDKPAFQPTKEGDQTDKGPIVHNVARNPAGNDAGGAVRDEPAVKPHSGGLTFEEVIDGEKEPQGVQPAAPIDVVEKPKTTNPPAAAPVILSAEDLYDQVSPCVVTIHMKDEDGVEIAIGSGFFIDEQALREGILARFSKSFQPEEDWEARAEREFNSDIIEWKKVIALQYTAENKTPYDAAYLLTNYHVIRGGADAEITLKDGASGKVFEVAVEDENKDLALLRVIFPSQRPMRGVKLTPADARVGATVYAIGSPKGLSSTISPGIVSGYRELSAGSHWLQTSAPISPGSSGGPLLLADGSVAGVMTLKRTGGENLNFAVPTSIVRDFLAQEFHTRNLSEGVSIGTHEMFAFFDTEYHLSDAARERSGPNAKSDAWNALNDAYKAMGDNHYAQAIAKAKLADNVLPNDYHYLSAYIVGKSNRQLSDNEKWSTLVKNSKSHDDLRDKYRVTALSREAQRSLELATKLKPDFAPAFAELVEFNLEAEYWQPAVTAADTLVKLMPQCAKAFVLRARAYDGLNNPRAAKENLLVAIDLNSGNGDVYLELGNVLRELHETDDAVDAYETGMQCKKNATPPAIAHSCIGFAYLDAGDFAKALTTLEQAKADGYRLQDVDQAIQKCKAHLQ